MLVNVNERAHADLWLDLLPAILVLEAHYWNGWLISVSPGEVIFPRISSRACTLIMLSAPASNSASWSLSGNGSMDRNRLVRLLAVWKGCGRKIDRKKLKEREGMGSYKIVGSGFISYIAGPKESIMVEFTGIA